MRLSFQDFLTSAYSYHVSFLLILSFINFIPRLHVLIMSYHKNFLYMYLFLRLQWRWRTFDHPSKWSLDRNLDQTVRLNSIISCSMKTITGNSDNNKKTNSINQLHRLTTFFAGTQLASVAQGEKHLMSQNQLLKLVASRRNWPTTPSHQLISQKREKNSQASYRPEKLTTLPPADFKKAQVLTF